MFTTGVRALLRACRGACAWCGAASWSLRHVRFHRGGVATNRAQGVNNLPSWLNGCRPSLPPPARAPQGVNNLLSMSVGDKITSAKVIAGAENLVKG